MCAQGPIALQKGYFRMVLNWLSETEGKEFSRSDAAAQR